MDHHGNMLRKTIGLRIPVFAVTFCFFGEICVGVAYCSYADEKRYSREIGRRTALKNAMKNALKRNGKEDHIVAKERKEVWEDYVKARATNRINQLKHDYRKRTKLVEGARKEGLKFLKDGLPTEDPSPMPSDEDKPLSIRQDRFEGPTIAPIYGGAKEQMDILKKHFAILAAGQGPIGVQGYRPPIDPEMPTAPPMPEDVISHLNERDHAKSAFLDNYRAICDRGEDLNRSMGEEVIEDQ